MSTRNGRTRKLLAAIGAVGVAASVLAIDDAAAVPPAPGTVIDDFDDGDATDWTFFGGNAAGGGGGAESDRPLGGTHYFSTGWGGQGTNSGFYGVAVKNYADTAQITPPADPWFNAWVYNQSDATVDAYTLEITIREDLDGNGWTDGSEDSFRLDTSFTSSDFDDRWTLVSAPVSSFTDLATGGDGTFDGDLDEIVLVIASVEGADGSTVELDLDEITFTSGAPAAPAEVLFDDMEHGDPFGNGWFAFNGAVGGGGITANNTDLPPALGGAFSLETGWGSGGTPGFYGGFGRTSPSDLSGMQYLNFWINPDAGQEYTLEINLQDDDDGDGLAESAGLDDEFQFNCEVSATGPCAEAGGGWQLVSIPLADFFDDNSFFNGGNGVFDPVPVASGGNGELISVVFAVIGGGSDVNLRTDYWAFSIDPIVPNVSDVIDDFESGLANGADGDGNPLGFFTFSDGASPISIVDQTTPPAPVRPDVGSPNRALQLDLDVVAFAGFIHAFENPAVDTWVSQDWSTYEGFSLWFHGNGSGTNVFIDILDNRNPGSTVDDAERWSVSFTDDFTGWQLLEFPFTDFSRKEIGNGAPNDGLGLFEMWGYAIGTLDTPSPQTYYIDDVAVYGIAEPPDLAVNLAMQNTFIDEGTTGDVTVKLNRPMGPDDPAEVSIDYATERSNAVPGEEFTPTNGTLTFVNGGATELTFPIETFDDTKFEGDEQIVIRLTNPVDVERGPLFQGSAFVADNDPFDPELLDDFEQGAYLWGSEGLVEFDPSADRVEVGDADERPGQDAVENVLTVDAPRAGDGFVAATEAVIADLEAALPSASWFDRLLIRVAIYRLEVSLNEHLRVNDFFLDHRSGRLVFSLTAQSVGLLDWVVHRNGAAAPAAQAAIDELAVIDLQLATDAIDVAELNGGDEAKIARALLELDRAEADLANGKPRKAINHYGTAWRFATKAIGDDASLAALVRDFPLGQDWTGTERLDFWFNGTGSGEEITVNLKDNRAPDPGPSDWDLVWSDEFDDPAGTPPNPANWAYELGDTTPDGKNGWGNEELQYYTDDPANAATDGNGNLVITLDEDTSGQECYYGPCEYTSARLITQNRAEFAYGRIESRLLVPDGGDGLWPAFWSLGTDIPYNPWPGAGEIDFMEYVSRLPNEIFGTIHGPGYSGGGSFNGIYDFGEPVFNDYHTFTVEWEPNLITWYVDGIQYHQAEPSDVPGPWVFEKPYFLLLNFAIGGNFGGAVDPANTYPQEYLVDYVRVYQGPDTAERFETTFTDSVDGWQQVSIPITDFVRSDDQPAGAPDDGLTLTDVWGYGLDIPYVAAGQYQLDFVQRVPIPPPTEVVVTTADDAGVGSLREALALVADGGTITFDPGLAGSTIGLTSGQLVADRSVTIDGSAAPGLVVSGSNASRVFEVVAGATVSMSDLEVADGVGAPQGGGILNFGTLSLDRVVVRDNTESSGGGASFDLGGGGIYNGDGATLNLTDSTVRDNATLGQPGGGVYGFFNSSINVTRSTISGNVGGDVAGGLRTLGNATIVNSTISGNTSTAWHGGALFATDGNVTISNSTIVGNNSPAGTAGGLMVATFGAPVTVTIEDNVIADNGTYNCQIEGGGAAVLTSLGGNVSTDPSCSAIGTDQIVGGGGAGVDALADNGGPTATHALLAGSPAIDSAVGTCPATDQRGVARPQGAGCDAGAFELE